MYHNVLAQPADDLPIAGHQVTCRSFQLQVERLRPHILHPFEAHDQLCKGYRPQGVVLTFDDGALGLLDAARILAHYGCVGVAFVCPDAFQNGLWFYKLADGLVRTTSGVLKWGRQQWPLRSAHERRWAYEEISERLFVCPAKVRDQSLAELWDSLQVPAGVPHPALTIMNEPLLRQMVQTRGMVLANHSWSHPNLVMLSSDEYRQEIGAAQRWLEASGLPFVPWFAFPQGVHDAQTRDAVRLCRLRGFGAGMVEPNDVLPRAGIYRMDANPWRFRAKTAVEGRLLRLKERARRYWRGNR
ncbi:MAG: polysaccharide deacetylase family protein [Acidobacteria bacterium]|nr:polysaccharide deacetylase family protein [Acidobacteriota bacterium]